LLRDKNPLSNNVKFISDYLAHLQTTGKSYSLINIHRSMLSVTLKPADGCPIGQHPLIVKLLKGCYNRNPPKPKYNVTWDPSLVLNFMASSGDNSALPISMLIGKLATLFALATLLRVSELASIPFSSIKFTENSVQFALSKPRKAQRNDPLQSFTLPACPDSDACPVASLRSYVERTGTNRPSKDEGMLFISTIAPFGPVTGNTVGRWIKNFLKTAGIDTSIFSAHSTRSAAASLAVARGLSIDAVLQAGHWASQTTFGRFYNRGVDATFAASVLNDA
jgi:integrase